MRSIGLELRDLIPYSSGLLKQKHVSESLIIFFSHLQSPCPQSKSVDVDLRKRETKLYLEKFFLCLDMHFRFRSLHMGGGWSHLSGGHCQGEDQGLHLGDIRLRYGQINSSEEKEGRLRYEKRIRINPHKCCCQEMIKISTCHKSQIEELKGVYWVGQLEVYWVFF